MKQTGKKKPYLSPKEACKKRRAQRTLLGIGLGIAAGLLMGLLVILLLRW